ncbi:hypothetical protein K469DRAFT_591806, partial [Zopfia rhizophila CBS 207.26]
TMEEKISLAASQTIHTYHCLCTHLLIATTTPLPSLPTRQNNTLDKAYIMPLPPPPSSNSTPSSDSQHFGMLLSTTADKKPEIIRSDSGFEKRYMQRCGRCSLVVGYQLDWQQFAGEAGRREGRREDVVYLVPGGFMTTQDMVKGKNMEGEIRFAGVTTVV